MEDRVPENVPVTVRNAVLAEDTEQIKEIGQEIFFRTLREGELSEEYFQLLLELLGWPPFLAFEGAGSFLAVLQNIWEDLSEQQKKQLFPALQAAYGNFSQSYSWFVVSELLGKCYANRQAFNALKQFKTLPEYPRSLVPHGLEYMVDNTDDTKLALEALEELLSMESDPSKLVRYEVQLSLQRLTNRADPQQ